MGQRTARVAVVLIRFGALAFAGAAFFAVNQGKKWHVIRAQREILAQAQYELHELNELGFDADDQPMRIVRDRSQRAQEHIDHAPCAAIANKGVTMKICKWQ